MNGIKIIAAMSAIKKIKNQLFLKDSVNVLKKLLAVYLIFEGYFFQ